jgi:hypothetical protein
MYPLEESLPAYSALRHPIYRLLEAHLTQVGYQKLVSADLIRIIKLIAIGPWVKINYTTTLKSSLII